MQRTPPRIFNHEHTPGTSSTLSAALGKPVVRLGRACLSLYLLSALAYTAWTGLSMLSRSLSLTSSNLSVPSSIQAALASRPASSRSYSDAPQDIDRGPGDTTAQSTQRQQQRQHHHQQSLRKISWKDYGRVLGVDWDVDVLSWPVMMSTDHHASVTVDMSEDLYLSKAFSESLQPTKIVPYYYRAGNVSEKRDITITTLVTRDRLPILVQLAERYKGPISVTIHVQNDAETRTELLESLHELYTTSKYMLDFVDVHLVVDNYDRQFNMWRNVAKFFSRTDYVMMLDVDFYICTDFRRRILSSEEIMTRLSEGNAAFVVPAFEYAEQSDGMDVTKFPQTKQDLLKLVEKGDQIGMFHASWRPGHGATNYTRYYSAQPGEVYKVRSYTHGYEPYVVFKKDGTPYCDERFIGYGANKAACLFELYLSGVSYYVLPDDFLIHQSHAYAEATRRDERKYNRKLYQDFREELCFRYLNSFIEDGRLNTTASRNLLIECKKIKGFASAASRIISAST